MVVLVGGSSTGKTRAAYEAVRRNLNDWPIIHPTTGDDLLALLERRSLDPRTVLWLNETQSYLQDDGRVAASLRRFLTSSKHDQIVVIGSMWPIYWKQLTAEQQQSDWQHQTRELLLHTVRRVTVPEAFSDSDLAALRNRRTIDPRLTVALEGCSDSGRVVQVLAGGPALIERLEEPAEAEDRHGQAVVTATMDGRMLGRYAPTTEAYLADVAAAYLDPEDRASAPANWFSMGLRNATQKVHGIAALTPRRDQPNVGPANSYVLHDYLFQHAQITRARAVVPEPVWDGLIAHTSDAADRARLARSAHDRHLIRHAFELALPASEAGDDDAMWLVARMLTDAGFEEEAEKQWKSIVASGHPDGLNAYVEFLDDQDREDDAIAVLLDAAEAGDTDAMRDIGHRLQQWPNITWEHSVETAEYWLRRAGQAGDTSAWLDLADLLELHGQHQAAEQAMYDAILAGSMPRTRALRFLAEWLTERERPDADRWTRIADRHEEAGAKRALTGQLKADEADDFMLMTTLTSPRPIWRMTERLAEKGQRVEADRLLRQAVLTGELGNVGQLVDMMQHAGRGDVVEEWLRGAVYDGNPAVITCLSHLLRESGHPDEAIQVLRDATARGDTNAWWPLARHLEIAGRLDEAEQIWRRMITREPHAMHMLVRLLEETGRVEEAEQWKLALTNYEDDENIIGDRVKLLTGDGRSDEAERWLRLRVEGGATWAGIHLAWFLREEGRNEEADRFAYFGIEPGGQTATPWFPSNLP